MIIDEIAAQRAIYLNEVERGLMQLWAPPPRLRLSQYANEHFYLSAESSAVEGKWTCIPYQVGILDAFSDPEIETVSCMKSARVGWTKCFNIVIAYHIDYDKCPLMVVQPTIEDAEGYSKEEIAPMIRDVPRLAAIFGESVTKQQTILDKRFPGGSISFVGANSPRGFRRVSRKVVLFDEIDGYPLSAGDEGDQIKLGTKRTEYYWDRKIGLGSTPTIDKLSRIQWHFSQGDQRRYYVPCPHCGYMDFLVFPSIPRSGIHWHKDDRERGHVMHWPKGHPEKVVFICVHGCGAAIEHSYKEQMIENGKWIARKETKSHASFHIWAAYSYSPNATWMHIAKEFDDLKDDNEKKTFYNTTLGEPVVEESKSKDWESLYNRREAYEVGKVPAKGLILTCGVDVQKDGFYYEVVAWGKGKRSWSIEAGKIAGMIETESKPWEELHNLLNRTFTHESGIELSISKMAVDSGNFTSSVYGWCRNYSLDLVMAVKGMPHASQVMLGSPVKIDYDSKGKKVGYSYWPVYQKLIKDEFFGFLNLNVPQDGKEPSGYCHFPQYEEEYFKQITAEVLVIEYDRRGNMTSYYKPQVGRQNHWGDCRVYARAAAFAFGIDRMKESEWDIYEGNLGIESIKSEEQKEIEKIQEENKEIEEQRKEQGSWIKPKGGFLNRRR